MKQEDLMSPIRLKLIADFPGNYHGAVGTIMNLKPHISREEAEKIYGKYPAVYKILEWWEHRGSVVRARVYKGIWVYIGSSFNILDIRSVPVGRGTYRKEYKLDLMGTEWEGKYPGAEYAWVGEEDIEIVYHPE